MSFPDLNIGLVIPESGPSGIFGPSCWASAELAIEEINEQGGILGREVVAVPIDGGAEPMEVAAQVQSMHVRGAIDAVVGWHTSAVRSRIAHAVGGRIPYVYTAVYEGGESTPGVFMTGEVPDGQVVPALTWMADNCGARSWYVVGSDYIWPRSTFAAVLDSVHRDGCGGRGVQLSAAEFLPLGVADFGQVLDAIEPAEVDGVLVLLLGQDAVQFNRAFAERGFDRDLVRLSPLMDENMLLASGRDAVSELYSASGYFESLVTSYTMSFESRYISRFGAAAPPLASPGESCYEGIALLARLALNAGRYDVGALKRQSTRAMDYESPRGHVRFERNHLSQNIYIARASGLDFDVVDQLATT
ncbi:substrate-binding domain-containing protein [Mycolicibacterium sp. S3B2]|uniref:substrate-binding domain-containing protein n=1 Tax=Mycolicibacterium sp. S3B2 TaxID=3415120 RepID=UPI003C7B3CDE